MDHREGRVMRQLLHLCGIKPQGSESAFADCAKTRLASRNQLFLRFRRHRCWPIHRQCDVC